MALVEFNQMADLRQSMQQAPQAEFSQAEVIDLDAQGGRVRLKSSMTGEMWECHCSEIRNEQGEETITHPRELLGGVVNVFKYPDRVMFLFAGKHGGRMIRQVFVDRQAIVEMVEEPNFNLWFWENDERMAIHHKLLKLDKKFTTCPLSTFFNSVVSVRFVKDGFPISASLVEYRHVPQADTKPTPQPAHTALPHQAVQPSRDSQYQQAASQPQSNYQEVQDPRQDAGQELRQEQMKGEQRDQAIIKLRNISLWLIAYIEKVTQLDPTSGDVQFIMNILGMLIELNDPLSSEHLQRLTTSIRMIEEASHRAEEARRTAQQYQQPKLVPAPQRPSPPAPPSQPPVQRAVQGRPVQTCENCRAGASLYDFCRHKLCRNCVISSAFKSACVVCQNTDLDQGRLAALESELGVDCHGCVVKSLTIDYCSHKICKQCILNVINTKQCFICDAPLDDAYNNFILAGVTMKCLNCNRAKACTELLEFDCKCLTCVECTVPRTDFVSCFRCKSKLTVTDKEKLVIYRS
jgi:hypothetical protein